MEEGYRSGESHAFRQRCQLVLLKSEGRTSEQVGQLLKMHPVTVNNWLNRYQAEGIAGLATKPGRGRKPVFEPARDLEQVRKAVVEERQRLSQAKLLLEQQLGKDFSLKTLKRFLKKLSAATNASGNG
ncbi:helix-turn-helix domain-containing protein [Pontibacter qinzhouensis]|uniref:Helix-turn-helix domain-containing protein n=1 Tax=Pontibacter qinzhouensis TaxID=2603253 RepID=A0A5C8J8J3_9BACT|nr:helix-turn-helix domain-containing protein [Pontibacter qinzhouensis]TXK33769.1 helix-turn-helix domain-containing protein [Pontibacter qinzhouensis]